MEIEVKQYQTKIAAESYQNFTLELKLTRRLAQKKLQDSLKQLCQQIQDAVAKGYLAQGQLIISGLPFPITFALQTGIINLPFQDYQKVNNFFEPEQRTEIHLYLVTFSEFINASHLRIDQVLADPSQAETQISEIVKMVNDNLQQALSNYDNRIQQPQKEAKDK